MVAAPDNRDLPNKEKEHTHTYSTERKKETNKTKNDGQIKKRQQRESQIPHCHAMVQW